jgi:hypothetical protein
VRWILLRFLFAFSPQDLVLYRQKAKFFVMSSFLLHILLLTGLVPASLAFNCSVPPIYVDIHNRVVHGTNIFQWGSFMGVGSPDQNQSLVPSLRQNETSVAWIDYCSDSDLPNCLESTGGNFDPTQSTRFV